MQYPITPSDSNWRILGASVAGTSHRKKGRGCDDNHTYQILDNGFVLLAVADGAGSASRAAEGAAYVVQEVCKTAQQLIIGATGPANTQEWNNVLSNILKKVRIGLEKHCMSMDDGYTPTSNNTVAPESTEQQQLVGRIGGEDKPVVSAHEAEMPPPSDMIKGTVRGEQSALKVAEDLRAFATTLQFVIISPQWLVAAQIGDGAVVIQRANNHIEAITWPDHGDYVNQTSFITDSDYLDQVQYVSMLSNDIQGIAMFTDGLERLALEFAVKKPYEPFFTPVFRFAADSNSKNEDLEAYLESAPVCERTSDDKTLVLAIPLSRKMTPTDFLD